MALIGLTKRNALCKICNCITDDDTLNEITLDILYSRRTYKEIVEVYQKYIPDFVDRLSEVNIQSHKRHCDPKLIAEENLRRKGEAVTPGDHAAVMYAERFFEPINKNAVLHSLYKGRINSIQFLRDLLNDKQIEYAKLKSTPNLDYTQLSKLKTLESEVKALIKRVDDVESDLQGVIIQDIKVEKGPGNTYINQNIINVMETNLKDFLGELVPYLLYKVFPNDLEKGKEVLAHVSGFMDKHLGPTMKKLSQTNVSQN